MIDTITALKQSASESVDELASKAYSLLDEIEALESQLAEIAEFATECDDETKGMYHMERRQTYAHVRDKLQAILNREKS